MSFKNGKNIKCKICSKEFYISGSRFGVRKYCSKECAKEDDYGFRPHTKNCAECGEEFKIENSLRTQDKLCSYECKNIVALRRAKEQSERKKKQPVIKKCKHCGEKVVSTAYSPQTFCGGVTGECYRDYLKKSRTGKTNPNYKNGIYTHANFQNRKSKVAYKHLNECRRYRVQFIKKHGYPFCEVCGVNSNGTQRHEVHHIYFASQYPRHPELHNDRNLVMVCIECHYKFHAGKTYRKEFLKLERSRKLKDLFAKK